MEKSISIAQMMPVIEEMLKQGNTVEFLPQGISMMPSIISGDIVTLKRPELPAKKYDIVLYTRNDGTVVLHRIVGMCAKKYIMAGDAQSYIEYPVTDKQIVGVVTRVMRADKEIYNADTRCILPFFIHDVRLWSAKARLRAGLFYRKHINKKL